MSESHFDRAPTTFSSSPNPLPTLNRSPVVTALGVAHHLVAVACALGTALVAWGASDFIGHPDRFKGLDSLGWLVESVMLGIVGLLMGLLGSSMALLGIWAGRTVLSRRPRGRWLSILVGGLWLFPVVISASLWESVPPAIELVIWGLAAVYAITAVAVPLIPQFATELRGR